MNLWRAIWHIKIIPNNFIHISLAKISKPKFWQQCAKMKFPPLLGGGTLEIHKAVFGTVKYAQMSMYSAPNNSTLVQ